MLKITSELAPSCGPETKIVFETKGHLNESDTEELEAKIVHLINWAVGKFREPEISTITVIE